MSKDKKIKFDIENGPVFFADEVGVIHNPLRIIMDFRSITPRVDVRNQTHQPLVIKHNVVLMDPYAAKNFLEILQKNLKNYEKEFGEIEKPKQLEKVEKEKKKSTGKADETKAPTYFG